MDWPSSCLPCWSVSKRLTSARCPPTFLLMFQVDSSMCIFWALSGVDTQEGGAPPPPREVQCRCATIVRHRLDTELVMRVQARNETGVQAQCLSIMLFQAWPRNRVPRACSSPFTLKGQDGLKKIANYNHSPHPAFFQHSARVLGGSYRVDLNIQAPGIAYLALYTLHTIPMG